MRWIFYNKNIDDEVFKKLKLNYNFSDHILKIFINRGFDTKEKIDKILNIDKSSFYSPFLFEDMEKAVNRVIKAIENKEKIVIYGDYDVDGVTAIVILVRFFKDELKYRNIAYYIPDRFDEGYGLNKEAIYSIKKEGCSLLITVDCGINSKEEVKFAFKNEIDVIVTDHHMPDINNFPEDAVAVINPKNSSNYPDKELSGVGVAYKLICGIAEKINLDIKDKFLDFVTLGTIADIVPLSYENRIIVRKGLKQLSNPENMGLKILKEKSGFKNNQPVATYHIGYILGPRINAAGRLEHAKKAVELFLSDDVNEIENIAEYLNNINNERKSIMGKIELEALKKIEGKFDEKENFIISLFDPNWNAGVIGLVASKISKKFFRPTIIFTKGENGLLHGSARSIYSVNIYETLKIAEKYIERFGGHKLAAGVILKMENLESFTKIINDYLKLNKTAEDFVNIIYIDDIIKEKIDIKEIKFLEYLQPWGEGNPAPNFLLEDVEIKEVKFYKNNTLKFYGLHNGKYYNFIIFNHDETIKNIFNEKIFLNIIVTPSINLWNEAESLQLEVKDIKKSKNL